MGEKRELFTKAFEEGAVRLVRTSARTEPEIAGDLGVGVWTLTRLAGAQPRPGDRGA